MTQQRISAGIALCRKENARAPIEILLVQRRVTYDFQDFIFGRYRLRDLSRIKHMLKNMTASEQSDLLVGNFEMLWWRSTYYKKDDHLDLYNNKLAKFNSFNSIHNLKNLISQSSNSLPLWQIPRGKHSSNRETDLNCAVRETFEETNIDKSMFKIVFEPVVYSYQENNYTYVIKYYPGWCQYAPHIGRLQPAKKHQTHEIVESRWFDMNMLRSIGNKRLEILVRRIFDAAKNAD